MKDGEKKWYVFKVMSRQEKKAASQLAKKQIEYYLPLRPKKRTWSDRIKIIEMPLFPGYIFVKIDFSSEKNALFSATGICGFISVDEKPAVMSEADIETIKKLTASSHELTTASIDNYPEGLEVKFDHGPFKGVTAVVKGVKNKKYIFVKFQMMGQMAVAEVDVMDIEKII